jgi:8-oxo-dGTP diphosphatase
MQKFSFCPVCGFKIEEKFLPKEERVRLICTKCEFIFYQNPKPTVSALIVNDKNQIILTKRGIEPFLNYWDIPGGFMEIGETPVDGLKREMLEELSVHIEPIRLLGIYMDTYGNEDITTLNIFYVAKIVTGNINPQSDVIDVKWFDLDNIPEKIAFKNSKSAIEDYKSGNICC